MRYLLVVLLFICTLTQSEAQMHLHGDTLLGNEWIDYDNTYHKIDVSEDGLYKITSEELSSNGISLNPGEKWQLWFMGAEVPLYVSNDDNFGADDFIIFYGNQNRNGLDSILFEDPQLQVNPRYSMFTDTSAYYLTQSASDVKRLSGGAVRFNHPGQSTPTFRRIYSIDSSQVFHKKYRRAGTQQLFESEFNVSTGFGSPLTSRYFQNVSLPHHVHKPDEKVKFGMRIGAQYVETGEELIVRYQVTTNIFEDDTLVSFEIADKVFELNSIASGQYLISLSRQNHLAQRLFFISNLYFEYASTFHLINNKINYTFSSADQNITLQNVNPNETYFLIDLNNKSFSILNTTSDTLQYAHTQSNGNYFLEQLDEINTLNHFTSVQFTPIPTYEEASFTVVTSRRLYNQAASPNAIDDYLDYRSSTIGGGYNTKLVFIEDLYDAHSYGIRRHPLALNNFSEQLKRTDPNGTILIIGKGRAFSLTRTAEELNHDDNNSFYVPSFGFPASDILTVSPVGKIAPRLVFGRLAVSHLDEVQTYLNNVIQYETLAPEVPSIDPNWKKKVVHLSGGNELANLIRNLLGTMSATFQQTPYSPDIVTFYKNGTVTVDTSFTDQIFNQINRGVSIVTFFGHAAPNTLGFRIDNEQKYDNAPLLPLFIALGCSSGNFNIPDESVAEAYCLMENKGFLNLISSAGVSIVFDLAYSGNSLYRLIGKQGDSLNVGQLFNGTVQSTLAKSRRQAAQLTLFGDPLIKLNTPKEIDVATDPASLSIDPGFLGTEIDSFTFTFEVLNHGLSPSQDVPIKIIRQLPGGQLSVLFDEKRPLIAYRNKISIQIPLESELAAGQNRLLVILDDENIIDEKLHPEAELNNEYIHSDNLPGFPIFIPSNSLIPLWPRDKSIVSSEELTFYSSTGNMLAPEGEYYLEIDTNLSFTSPAFLQFSKTSSGGVIEFTPNYPFDQETVYYWRMSPERDSESNEYYWTNPKSFIILSEKEGWNISHFHQFAQTEKEGIDVFPGERWEYTKNFIPVRFGTGIWESDNQDQLGWFEFNSPFPRTTSLAWDVDQVALAIIAFDHNQNRFEHIRSGRNYGSLPIIKDKDFFAFANTIAGRDSLIHFIEHVIPENYNILFHTVRINASDMINTSEWALDSLRNNGTNIYNLLERYGAQSIRRLDEQTTVNYLNHFTKEKGYVFEEISFDDDKVISHDFNLLNWNTYGTISLENTIIENEDRERLEWKFDSDKADSFDSYNIYYQEEENGNKSYTDQNVLSGNRSFSDFPDSIKKHAIFGSDVIEANLTAPSAAQPIYYRLYGEVIGDYALAPNVAWTAPKSTYLLNESIEASIAVYNMNHKETAVSIEVRARNLNTNEELIIDQKTIEITSGMSTVFDFSGPISQSGIYSLEIEINPAKEIKEANYFNNILIIPVEILQDQAAPIIDVTFDGRRISNDQIVSPSSQIRVTLTDEQPYLRLDDPGYIFTQITQPDGSTFDIFPGVNAEYVIADMNSANRLELIINGNFEQEGRYHLTAYGRDVSGNENQPAYQIDFQIYHSTGLGIKTYPNPVTDYLSLEYIYFDGAKNDQATFYINNALGQTVLNSPIKLNEGQNVMTIKVPSSWPMGTYHYQLITKNENGGDMTEYVDEDLGFQAGGARGSFVLVRED